jgi:hypothetical protein
MDSTRVAYSTLFAHATGCGMKIPAASSLLTPPAPAQFLDALGAETEIDLIASVAAFIHLRGIYTIAYGVNEERP